MKKSSETVRSFEALAQLMGIQINAQPAQPPPTDPDPAYTEMQLGTGVLFLEVFGAARAVEILRKESKYGRVDYGYRNAKHSLRRQFNAAVRKGRSNEQADALRKRFERTAIMRVTQATAFEIILELAIETIQNGAAEIALRRQSGSKKDPGR